MTHSGTYHTREQSTAAVLFFPSLSFRCLGPRLSPRLSHAVHADISTANILTSLPSCSVFRVPLPSSAVHTVAGTVPSAALTTDSAVPRSRSNKGPKAQDRRLGCAGVVGVGWACVGVGIGVDELRTATYMPCLLYPDYLLAYLVALTHSLPTVHGFTLHDTTL